jgi:thiamine-phosphate diphosphorylase
MLVTEPLPAIGWVVSEAVAAGVNMVVARRKLSDSAEAAELEQIITATEGRALLVLNGYSVSSMQRLSVPGLHLSEQAQAPAEFWARRALSPESVIGRSVHSEESAMRAEQEGVDYVLAGTIFASASHPEIQPGGVELLSRICAAVSIPVIAIGGIRPDSVGHCLRAGAAGVAVLSGIMRAPDPREAAGAYRRALDSAVPPSRSALRDKQP